MNDIFTIYAFLIGIFAGIFFQKIGIYIDMLNSFDEGRPIRIHNKLFYIKHIESLK